MHLVSKMGSWVEMEQCWHTVNSSQSQGERYEHPASRHQHLSEEKHAGGAASGHGRDAGEARNFWPFSGMDTART